MQNWKLLEQVFTVETIMTPRPQLLCWAQDRSLKEVQEEADKKGYETIPVLENDQITSVLYRGSDIPVKVEKDQFVPHSFSIPGALNRLANRNEKESFLLVTFQNMVVGLVVPSDLNKLAARTYFYNLLAELERKIAAQTQEYFDNEDAKILEIVETQLCNNNSEKGAKRWDDIQARYWQMKQDDLEINVIHLLNFSEFVNIVHKTDELREQLGFPSRKSVEKALNGLVHLRNDVMHPSNLLVSKQRTTQKFAQQVQTAIDLLNEWRTTPEIEV